MSKTKTEPSFTARMINLKIAAAEQALAALEAAHNHLTWGAPNTPANKKASKALFVEEERLRNPAWNLTQSLEQHYSDQIGDN